MKERLMNNLGLKILSVVLAVFMWLIMVNVSNPLVTDSKEVQVEMLNADVLENANLTYEMIGKNTVTVSYEVRIRDKYRISSSDFYAYADLAELYDVTGSIPVKVEISNRNVRSLIEGTPSTKPGVVRIQTEPIQRKRFELVAHHEGTPEEGFAVGDVTLNPEYIYVTGAVSVIGQISSVGVEVNVEGVNSDMDGSAAIRLYDANNNELSLGDKVELNLEEVDYHVTILKVKSLALDFQVGGTVADGYRFTGVECNLKTVSVEGLKSTLASISTLTIPKEVLTVEGAKGDRQVEVDLASLLPDNITIANGTETKALVTLKVEALVVREVEYDLQDAELVGEREEYSYSFDQDQTVLQIRGLEEDLDMIQTEDIKLRIDVEDLESGVYPAVIDVDLSQGFELVGCGSLTITVEEPEEETVEEEEE